MEYAMSNGKLSLSEYVARRMAGLSEETRVRDGRYYATPIVREKGSADGQVHRLSGDITIEGRFLSITTKDGTEIDEKQCRAIYNAYLYSIGLFMNSGIKNTAGVSKKAPALTEEQKLANRITAKASANATKAKNAKNAAVVDTIEVEAAKVGMETNAYMKMLIELKALQDENKAKKAKK